MKSTAERSLDHQRLSRVIFEYAGRIGREQDREALLSLIADMGRDLVGADRCSIWLIDESARQLVTRIAHGAGVIRIDLGKGLVGHCVNTGDVVLSNAVAAERQFESPVDAQTGYHTRSLLVVPMRSADGKVIGAFQALNKPGGFEYRDADLLSLAAAYSASTLETQFLLLKAEEGRRIQRELEIAREVQQRLLPGENLPAVAGIEFAGVCRPAAEVGGDFYSFLPTSGGGLSIALGDISGKGIAAALMMASVQASLQGLVLQGPAAPGDLMARLNDLVHRSSTASRYSTMFYAQYEPANRTLTCVNAGHGYPLLLRSGGLLEQLNAGGPPIGLLPEISYEQETVTLDEGDTLICYSDGISESTSLKGVMWNDEAVQEAIVASRGRPVAELVTCILDAADRFASGAKQYDDMTVVCLRGTR